LERHNAGARGKYASCVEAAAVKQKRANQNGYVRSATDETKKRVTLKTLQNFLQRYALFCKNITSDRFQAAEVAGARVHAKFRSH